MIITNFKTYESCTGEAALKLAKIHEEVAKETGAHIQIAVQAIDLFRISQKVTIPVLSQHIDPVGFGGHTGSISPQSVKMMGGVGTLLNHSEKRLERSVLKESIRQAKEAGLATIVCAATPEEGASYLEFDPDFIAVEPPELIGDPNLSVATAKPEIIKNAVKLIGNDRLIVGAGVKDGEDVRISMKLGAQGVLLASAIARAEDPKAILMDLVSGLK